ncbi:unnamed protein product [Caenorhabditis auriculariae]|uniref:SAM-dependent MTase RsmB/NOP-type domain-containing protein n=1 Tax=Caenorhabditis auriculariae TaxID=2777116 RepID=A0A8S1GRC7_9PELO|nr:unnamed protein product [Caenorhabditis auriculariae]
MGKQAKRRIWKKKQKGNRDQTYTDERKDDGYSQAIKENEKYWSFYRAQGFFNDEEFEAFRAALQRELPVSFRFQGCNKDREQMKSEMESRFFSKIHDSDDASVCAPKAIPWYTEAYQTPMPRAAVRSHPILTQLHNFLVTETELGNLSRQEAVSMIPPLLLQPTSDHFVLDLCAAPGSKTAQLIEMIHRDTDNPKGMVVANDLDKKRCYMLIRQTLKRFHTPSCVVTCEDATNYPKISAKNGSEIKFDRVLADVICSGDGTMRKNPGIWKTWSPQEGLGLHRLQLSIARRAAEMLRVGGQMVYSTCSLNPIEDEAVVAQLLREAKGALRLVDTREKLPELKRLAGVSTWRVFDKEMREFKTPSEVEEKLSKMICASCFPPTEEEATKFHLDYSMRIAPHQNDTGGFYVALIEKVSETDFENNIFSGPQWKRQKMYKDEPFSFLRENDDRWKDISGHYGVAENFPYQKSVQSST